MQKKIKIFAFMVILFMLMPLGIKADAATTLRTGKIHVDAYDFYDVNFHSSGNGYIDIEYKIIHNGNDTGNYILELLDDDDNTIEKDDIEIISDSSCNELIYCPKRTTSGNFTYRFNNYSDIPFTVQYSVKLYPSLATGFSFTKSNITLDIGKSVDILINSTPSNSLFVWKDGNFTKSDIAYATYSYKKFTITGNEPGTTILWIKTYNNIKKQIKITVRKPSTPKLKTTSLSLLIGEKYVNQLLYSSSSIKWKSSNKRIATVDKKGKITAKKSGSCTITAISGGKKFSCKVKVVRLDPNFGAVLYDYNSRGKTYTVKFKNNGKKSITILSSNAKALHDDYKSLDRSLKVKKTVIKPGKTAYIKFRASKQPYYDSDEYTIQYKFTYDGATYTGQTWCEESIYKKGKSWYGTYWTSYEDWYQSWIWD